MPSLRSRSRDKSARHRVLLSVKFIDTYIGSGVFAEEDIDKGRFICFYDGLLISGEEGSKRFSSLPENQGSFLFFFRHKGQELCVDATHSQGYGRMMNDSRKPNCKVVVEQNEELKLAIYTITDIEKGSELRFDYNDKTAYWRRKGAVEESLYQVPGLVPFETETSEAVHSQTKTSETVEGPDPIETETSKSVVDPDPIETVAVDSQTETSVETDPATSSGLVPFETETSEAVYSQTETSEAVEGPDPIETETSKSVVDPDPIETVAVDSQTETSDETDPATSSDLVPFETETSEAVYSQTETSEAVEGPDPIETETSKSVVDPDPIETVAVDSQTETSDETDPATSSGLVPFETETSEAVYSQTETSEAVEGPDPIETETSKSVVDPDPIETVAVDSQTETSDETDPATSSDVTIETLTSETVNCQTKACKTINSQTRTAPDPNNIRDLNQSCMQTVLNMCQTTLGNKILVDCSKFSEMSKTDESAHSMEAVNYQTETDNESFDDSLADPDYVENENESDLNDLTDMSDYDMSFSNGKRKSPDNACNQQKKQKTVKTSSYDATEYISDSDNESCASDKIPDMSKFLLDESSYVSCENHEESAQPCTSTLSKESHKNGQFGLLPKKNKKAGCKQVYDKINYCTYCMKAISSKISRHLLCVHKAEPRVSDILTLPKRSPARMAKLEILANEGNFKHNLEVLKKKKGFLVVGRRESNVQDFKSSMYLPCNFCKKFILKNTLWLHERNCSVRKVLENCGQSKEQGKSGNPVRLSRELLNSALIEDVDTHVSKLLSRMHHDEITEEVQKDDLIKKYAALKVESLGREQDHKINDIHRISQSCRTLARVVIKCREKSEHIITMDSLIRPENFDLIVDTTKSMCLDDAKAAPSLGKLVGNNLSHIIQVKKGFALRKGEDKKLQEAENFQRLFTLEWNYRVNSVCQKMTNTINRQKVKTIPLTEDLQLLRSYILKSLRMASDSLLKISCAEVWTRLAKLTLCRLILFNKRRRAEVKDLKVTEFESRPNWQQEQRGEFEMALSTSDRLLAKRMDMVLSAGKSRKNVDAYVILPPDAKKAIELLNSTRMTVGVLGTNPYVFARLNSNTPLSGNGDLKELVDQCPGIQHPERITSTGLRRYIATVSQILDMSDSELDALARHLGHDVQTHKSNYRLSHATRELTVVSQLLMAVDGGCVNKWRGKQLKDISVEELPDINQLLDENESDDEASEERGLVPFETETSEAVYSQTETSEAVEGPDPIETETSKSDVDPDPIETVAVDSQTETSVETDPATSSGKRGEKRRWTKSAEEFLRRAFKSYLTRKAASVHNTDIIMAQNTCAELSERSKAQIRSKLNNMKLGKSK